jgi:hypothetical protein
MNEIVDIVISALFVNEIVVLDCEQISYIKTQRKILLRNVAITYNTKIALAVHAFIHQFSNIKRKIQKCNVHIYFYQSI